jgi:hypothetical protein
LYFYFTEDAGFWCNDNYFSDASSFQHAKHCPLMMAEDVDE